MTPAGNTDSILNDLVTSSSIAPRGIDADKDVGSVDADVTSDEEEFTEGYVLKSILFGSMTLLYYNSLLYKYISYVIRQLIACNGQKSDQ